MVAGNAHSLQTKNISASFASINIGTIETVSTYNSGEARKGALHAYQGYIPYLRPWMLVEHAHDGDLSHGSLPGPCRRSQQDAFVAVVEHMEQLRLDRVEVLVPAPKQKNHARVHPGRGQ